MSDKKRGGYRPNAGRKPIGEEALSATIIARVTPKQKENFKAFGGGDWLRSALTLPEVSESRDLPDWVQKVHPIKQLSVPVFQYSVQAGFPSPAESYKETLDFNELLVNNESSTFVLRVSGESMVDAGIFEDDLIVVDRSRTPKHSDIVVMQIDNEYTVKRFMKTSDGFYLKAENSSGLYKDIYPEEGQEWHLFGVVNYAIKSLAARKVS